MLPNRRIVMSETVRLLSKKDLKQYVLYSPQHIARLEKAGLFPKRLRLGPHVASRVGWLKSEVLAWLKVRIENRERGDGAAP